MALAKIFQDAINNKTSVFSDEHDTGINFMELEVGHTLVYEGDAWTYVGFHKGESVWLGKGRKYIFTLRMMFGRFAWFGDLRKTKTLLSDITLLTGNDIKEYLLAHPWQEAK